MVRVMRNLFYDSVKDFIDDVSKPPEGGWKLEYHKNRWQRLEVSRAGSFNGSFKNIVDKYRKHDVKREASVLAGVMNEINCADFTERAWEYRQRLEEGDIIDVNRYLDGHEKFWCGVKRSFRTKQVVRVYCGFGGNCGRSPEELAVCGAVCVTLCEILESMGIGVELWGIGAASGLFTNGDDGETLIKLKGSDDGLGRMKIPSAEDIGLCEEEARAAIVVPQMFDISSAKNWLKELLEKLPGKMEGKKEDAE